MMEGSGTLEAQLEATKRKLAEVRSQRIQLKQIEDLGALLEEHLILDNRFEQLYKFIHIGIDINT